MHRRKWSFSHFKCEPTCLISHFSGSEILVSLLRSSVSSCSSSGAWPRFRLLGRSGFLMEISSPPSGPTFLLLLGFRSSPVSWSTSWQTEEEIKTFHYLYPELRHNSWKISKKIWFSSTGWNSPEWINTYVYNIINVKLIKHKLFDKNLISSGRIRRKTSENFLHFNTEILYLLY